MIDPEKLIRDASKVYPAMREDGETMVAVSQIKMIIPERFVEHELATFAEEISTLAMVAFVVDDKYYAVSKIPAIWRTEPTLINKININDEPHIELTYMPGARVISNLNLVKVDSLLYRIYDEMIAKGRVPWYFNYDDICSLYEFSNYHAGKTVGANHSVFEVVAAAIARGPTDVRTYYRQEITEPTKDYKNRPMYIPLRAVSYGATNVVAKILGSHFNENVTSSLVSPGERVERIEALLRM